MRLKDKEAKKKEFGLTGKKNQPLDSRKKVTLVCQGGVFVFFHNSGPVKSFSTAFFLPLAQNIDMSFSSKLVSTTNNGTGAFVLQCRKLVFNYCELWGSNKGMV